MSSKMSDNLLESECGDTAYVNILKDLAEAVKRPARAPTPPVSTKRGQLQMWGDLLVANISDLPVEMQHEARFNINSYLLSLRCQVRPYNVMSTP